MRFVLIVLTTFIPGALPSRRSNSVTMPRARPISKRTRRSRRRPAQAAPVRTHSPIWRSNCGRSSGPFKFKAVGAEGRINLDTLVKGDEGFGMLDAMACASADDKTRIVVTTGALLKRWLKEHRSWWREGNVPRDVDKALRSESFYTQAISTDSAETLPSK